MGYTLHDYQEEAVTWILDRFQELPGVGLFADPGLGKTLMSLEVIRRGGFERVLVIAPLRCVYSVWPPELEKWKPFELDYNVAHGAKKYVGGHRIDIINRDAMVWLDKQELPDYDLVIFDEITSFKAWTTQRTKAVKRILKRLPNAKRLGLTGTPAPNTYSDLFSQLFLLDKGEALGATITKFRQTYCYLGGFRGRQWLFDPRRAHRLESEILDRTLRLDCLDFLDLPTLVYNDVRVHLSPGDKKVYQSLERDLYAILEDEGALCLSTASAAYGACRQVANGRIYSNPEDQQESKREVTVIHKHKVKAVSELLGELNGKPALIAYSFKHDLEALQELPELKGAGVINGDTSGAEAAEIIDRWNARQLRYLIVHPSSVSHGVNLQAGGNDLIWYSLTDKLEDYLQLNRRLWRQGVEGQVRIHHLISQGTLDEAVLSRLQLKTDNQMNLLDFLKEYRKCATK